MVKSAHHNVNARLKCATVATSTLPTSTLASILTLLYRFGYVNSMRFVKGVTIVPHSAFGLFWVPEQ